MVNIVMEKNDCLIPILVRSPGGRSGTSLMMEVLSSSPKISFDRQHPYEVRMLSYFYRLSMIMHAEKGHDWKNDMLVQSNLKNVGPIPIMSSLISDPVKFSHEHFSSSWAEFSKEVKNNNSNALFYAEKIPHDVLDVVKGILSCKIIYLVRDPRAELASIINFNKKRGSNFFGWKGEDTIESFTSRFILQRSSYFEMIEKQLEDINCLVIKYENLVLDIDRVCGELSDYLSVSVNASKVMENIKSNSKHMTSSDPRSSLTQWQKDLPETIIEKLNVNLIEKLSNNFYKR